MKAGRIALILSIGIHGAFFQLFMPSKKSVFETGKETHSIAVRMVQVKLAKKPSTLNTIEQKRPDPPKISKQKTKTTKKAKDRQKPISRKVAVKPRALPKPPKASLSTQHLVSTRRRRDPLQSTGKKILSLKGIGPNKKPEVLQQSFQDLKGGYQVMPVYPIAARRERREGEVLLKVQILESGRIGALTIVRSSQSADLDSAAIDAVRQWHFEPAIQNGLTIQQTTLLPIRFNLTSN